MHIERLSLWRCPAVDSVHYVWLVILCSILISADSVGLFVMQDGLTRRLYYSAICNVILTEQTVIHNCCVIGAVIIPLSLMDIIISKIAILWASMFTCLLLYASADTHAYMYSTRVSDNSNIIMVSSLNKRHYDHYRIII